MNRLIHTDNPQDSAPQETVTENAGELNKTANSEPVPEFKDEYPQGSEPLKSKRYVCDSCTGEADTFTDDEIKDIKSITCKACGKTNPFKYENLIDLYL